MDNSLKNTNKINVAIIIAIILYPLCFIWQGLDFTDTGYVLSSYQQIFSSPDSIYVTFVFWLTNIIGGAWLILFPSSGLLGLKIAYVLIIYIILLVIYYSIKGLYSNKTSILLSLLLTMMFITKNSVFWLGYQNLTALFYVLIGCILFKSMEKNTPMLIFSAGFIAGINMFIRLPNCLGIILILAIIYAGYIFKEHINAVIKKCILFVSGYFTGIILIIITMICLNHFGLFLKTINETFFTAKDPTFHHSYSSITTYFIISLAFIIALALLAISLVYIIQKLINKIDSKILQWLCIGIIVSIGVIFFQGLTRCTWTFAGILYFYLILIIFNIIQNNNEVKLIAFISLIILFIASMGSMSSFGKIYGMWLSFPIVLLGIFNIKTFNFSKISLNKNEVLIGKRILLLIIVFTALITKYRYTYLDSCNRFEMVYSVKHNKLKGVFTTKERAQVVQELLDELPKYINKDTTLLAFGNIPLVHYLTSTEPYLNNPWPTIYTNKQFIKQFKTAESEKKLPVIVLAKGSTRYYKWPIKSDVFTIDPADKKILYIKKFIVKYNYVKQWNNSFFEIWVP